MENWQEIDDVKAKQMLSEIFENVHDDHLISKYSDALEKRYRKPEGTISDYIFWDDLSIDEILTKLKIDTVTYL